MEKQYTYFFIDPRCRGASALSSRMTTISEILELEQSILEVMGWMGYSILIIYGVSVYEVETGAD